jgi:DNA-binding beta-propeller fold protein YncE
MLAKKHSFYLAGFAGIVLYLSNCSVEPAVPPLALLKTIELPGVSGRIDHMDIDPKARRLFVGALENDSLEVVDLEKGMVIKSVKGLGGPQGVAFVPETNAIYVSARGTGDLLVFDAASLQETKRFSFGSEADNLHYLPQKHQVILGYGSGGIAIIDPLASRLVGTVDLDGHPEGIAGQEAGPLVFANVPTSRALYVLDGGAMKVIKTISPEGILSNFPLALDAAGRRGAYFTYVPRQVALFDTATFQTIAKRDSPGDVNDLFFNPAGDRLFLISGDGRVEVWSVDGDGTMSPIAFARTALGARTGLYSPALGQVFAAAPAREGKPARIFVFAAP